MDMSRSSSLFASDYSLTPTQSRDDDTPGAGVSPTTPVPRRLRSPMHSPSHSPSLSPTPRRITKARMSAPPSPRVRTGRRDYPACMEAGIGHESRSQALGHVGPSSERHLRAAASLFESALAQQPGAWPALRLATVLYHLSTHCRPLEAAGLLREARELAAGDGPALEARAAICARLSALLRMPGDDLASEAGEAASAALDAFEDVANDRMDRASTLSKADFELEAPGLAATFLALAEAAAAVCTLSDPYAAEPHAELADHALAHAANMATVARAPALLTHIQLVGARIAAERLAFYARWDEVSWDDLLADLGTLASQTRELAQRLRGSRGAAAAEQAAEAAKLLADTRVMYAAYLGRDTSPQTPGTSSARSSTFVASPVSATLATPHSVEFSPPDPTPGLSSSSGSWSSSTGSPPILEEPEEEEEDDGVGVAPAIPDPAAAVSPPRKRAPPPPPLKLAQRPPRPVMQPMSPRNPQPALSPLNPARQAMRPRLLRCSGFAQSPMAPDTPIPPAQVQWNELAAAGKGYKLALSLLQAASLPAHERARRKSDLLFAVASTALARAELAPRLVQIPGNGNGNAALPRSGSGSYFSPTAPHASPESLRSLRQLASRTHTRGYTYPRSPRIVPATPRPDPRSGTRTTGAAALRATAEVYAAWAAREVGWSALIDPRGRLADRRTGAAGADEAGLRAVLLALRVWWVRAVAGDREEEGTGSSDDDGRRKRGSWESVDDSPGTDSPSPRKGAGEAGASLISVPDAVEVPGSPELQVREDAFGVPPATARRIAGVLHRLKREGAGPDDVCRFVAPLGLGEDERAFWAEIEDVLA